jgi:hypothetical protein
MIGVVQCSSRILDPGVKKAPDPGSATLVGGSKFGGLNNDPRLQTLIRIITFCIRNPSKQCCGVGTEEPKLNCLPEPKLRVAAPTPF